MEASDKGWMAGEGVQVSSPWDIGDHNSGEGSPRQQEDTSLGVRSSRKTWVPGSCRVLTGILYHSS